MIKSEISPHLGWVTFPTGEFRKARLVMSDSGNIWRRANGKIVNPWLTCFDDHFLVVKFASTPSQAIIFRPFYNAQYQCGVRPMLAGKKVSSFWHKVSVNVGKAQTRKFNIRFSYFPMAQFVPRKRAR